MKREHIVAGLLTVAFVCLMVSVGTTMVVLSTEVFAQDSPTVSSIRDSQYEWQCETESGDLISGHTRQDKASERCFNEALANPGATYIVRAGAYRVTATVPDQPTQPPEPPSPPPPEPNPSNPLVTFGPVNVPTRYPGAIQSLKRDEFTWRIEFTANSLIGQQSGLVSRDQSGRDDKGHLTVFVEEVTTGEHRVKVRNQDVQGGGATTTLAGSTQIVPGQNYTVEVGLIDGDWIGLYVDGNLEDSSTAAYGLADNDLDVVVGGSCTTCEPDGSAGVTDPLDGTTYLEVWAEAIQTPQASTATVRWKAPTHYDDGAPIEAGELAAFRVYMTEPEAQLLGQVEGDVELFEYVTFDGGRHCFQVTAVAGAESARSATACREL